MTLPDATITLGTLAAQHPASIPILELRGLDYCCGGTQTLSAACAARSLDAGEVLDAVISRENDPKASIEQSWDTATMTELADHIEQTHHAFVRETLARLKVVIPCVLNAHGAKDPRLTELAGVVRHFEEDMRDHMVREERVLFPWLRRLERKSEIQSGPPWSVRRPISCMVHDHDDAGAALARMRSLTDNYAAPPGACVTYRSLLGLLEELERDTHIHIHKENNILFPAGVRAEDRGANRASESAGSEAPQRLASSPTAQSS